MIQKQNLTSAFTSPRHLEKTVIGQVRKTTLFIILTHLKILEKSSLSSGSIIKHMQKSNEVITDLCYLLSTYFLMIFN